MDEPTGWINAPRAPASEFDDPALEAAFGLESPDDWVTRARQAEAPRPSPGYIGSYQLLEEIGRGGQGVVYKAVQPGTSRVIAIKCFPTGPLKSGKRDRFEREVQALIRLNHPSIVTVHGAEVVSGSPILIMEHIDGSPIDRWADGQSPNRRPRSEILAAFARVCDAVSHAHQRGVIHRDLKPSNVLVDATGTPRVLDFGIARLVDDLQPSRSMTLTEFVGTPSYASPEQLEDTTQADTRTDIYSLGVLLYRVLTGTEPFPRSLSMPALVNAIRDGVVRRPSLACPTLPHEIDWVILKAMCPDPALRYQSVEALATDIRRFLNGEPVEAHPPSTAYAVSKFVRRHAMTCTAAAAALALILSLAGFSVAQSIRLSRQNHDLTLAVQRESQARFAADQQTARADSQVASHSLLTDAVANIVAGIAARANRATNVTSKDLFGIIEPELAKVAEPEHPEVRMQFLTLRARVALSARRLEESLEYWTRALETARMLESPDAMVMARLHEDRANVLSRLHRYDEALEETKDAIQTPDLMGRYRTTSLIRFIHSAMKDHEGAKLYAGRLLMMAGNNLRMRADAFESLSFVNESMGQLPEAIGDMTAALTALVDDGAGAGLDAARFRVRLATLHLANGNAAAAEPLAAEAVPVRLRRCGALHIRTQEALISHAEALSRLGRFAEAAADLETIRPRFEAAYGLTSKRLASHRFKLAAAHLGAGAAHDARRHLALAISLGASAEPDQEQLKPDVKLCEGALFANAYQVNQRLAVPLGSLAWLVEGAPEVSNSGLDPRGQDSPDP